MTGIATPIPIPASAPSERPVFDVFVAAPLADVLEFAVVLEVVIAMVDVTVLGETANPFTSLLDPVLYAAGQTKGPKLAVNSACQVWNCHDVIAGGRQVSAEGSMEE
jgi:hypothetical protein